jgi:hypothetical protein
VSEVAEKLYIQDEELFFKAIDPNLIKSWEQFEYLLTLIIENRLLLLF